MSESTGEKAKRLMRDKRVRKARPNVTTYEVLGDTGAYVVVVRSAREVVCNCPATVEDCSHAKAALAWHRLTMQDTDDVLTVKGERLNVGQWCVDSIDRACEVLRIESDPDEGPVVYVLYDDGETERYQTWPIPRGEGLRQCADLARVIA